MGDPVRSGWYGCIVEQEGVAGEQRSDSPAVEPAPPGESPATQPDGRGGGARSVRQQTQNEDGCRAVLVILDVRSTSPAYRTLVGGRPLAGRRVGR
jgi:hypothetical protein